MKASGRFMDLLLNNWWLRHLLFWIFVVLYFAWGFGFINYTPKEAIINSALFFPGHLVVVYPLLYFLIPHFLVKKKFLLFFACFVACLAFAALITSLTQLLTASIPALKGYNSKIGKNVLPYIHIAGLAASLKLIKYSYFQQDRAVSAIQQKTMAELELLKAQVHPHFLFNTLNNLFAHTLRNSSDSPQIVVKLSDLLRFMIYESKADLIPLAQEIQLLQNYLDLEKLRYAQELDISFTYSGDIEGNLIRPLLLLPLVENSFKHGASQQLEQKWISMDLHVEKHTMHFKLANSTDRGKSKNAERDNKTGFGIDNVKKRLDLLYQGDYILSIKEEEDMFLISLDLNLIDTKQSHINEHETVARVQPAL